MRMGFVDAVANGLLNYSRFRGRATPRELGFWLLAVVGASLFNILFDALVAGPLLGFAPFAAEAGRPLTLLGSLALLTPTLAVAARRLHDAGRSARWLALVAVPVLGWVALGWMLSRPSQSGANRYGDSVEGLYRT